MSEKTNLGLNVSTLVALMIALVVGSVIAADLYNIVNEIKIQNKANGDGVNKTVSQLIAIQEKSNARGNSTIDYFRQLFQQVIYSEHIIIGNLSDHRKIANITRDHDQERFDELANLLKQIINQTR